jgi:shikimate dehydrogenase
VLLKGLFFLAAILKYESPRWSQEDKMLCGLIGKNLAHSYSAIIHEEIGRYSYDLINLSEEELERFLQRRDFRGINVTIPYKKSVIPYCDSLDTTALRIGSVNTIVNDSEGKLRGYNTDYFGFLAMCKCSNIDFKGKKVLILGSGGTSATVHAVATDMGASEIIVVSRTGRENYSNVDRHMDSNVIVNTTPVGMYPNNGECLIDLNEFTNCTGVVDVIYNPLRTRLIQHAQELGIPCVGGLTMLVAQACYSAQLFTGGKSRGDHSSAQKVSGDENIARLQRSLLRGVCNITLIGMPGSGKTSIGNKVASMLDREFIDTDTLISQRVGMTIPEIFERHGEAYFRSVESDVIAEYSKLSGKVISSGGGAVLSEENRRNILQNSFVVQITRSIDELEAEGRPLSRSLDTLRRMADERQPLYDMCSMATVQNDGSVENAARRVVEVFNAYTGD